MSTADATGDEFREYPAHHDAGFEGPEEPTASRGAVGRGAEAA